MKRDHLHKITVVALFSAVSTVLMFLSINVPFVPSYLKLDFSDLPALLTSFSLGPVWGVAVSLVKNAINIFFSTTGGVGELSNFLLSAFFVFTSGVVYKYNKTKSGALLGACAGLMVMTGISYFTNTYLVYPVYTNLFGLDAIVAMSSSIHTSIDSVEKIILVFNMPFTFFKGFVNAVLTFLLYKKLSPIMKIGK